MIKNGYHYIKRPNHPNANKNGWIKRSRYNMTIKLGRQLYQGEDVHHNSGDKLDDSLDNIRLVTHSEHSKITAKCQTDNKGVCHCNRPWSNKTYRGYEIKGFNLKKIFHLLHYS